MTPRFDRDVRRLLLLLPLLRFESAFLALAREDLAVHFAHGFAAKVTADGSWINVGDHTDLSDELGS
jgi:hypothetical protein